MTGIAAIPDRVPKEASEPDSLLSQLLDESGKLPLIGLVPKISKLVAASLDPSTTRPLDHFQSDWWRQRGERELEDLPQMEPGAIVECLPKLWAADLRDSLEAASHKPQAASNEGQKPKGKSQEPKAKTGESGVSQVQNDGRGTINDERATRKAVLFIDAYEQLWGTGDGGQETGDSKQKTDEWVREMVKQLPEALWVICGRQKLRWEEVDKDWSNALSQHELNPLPDQASRQFLASCGIASEPIQDAIMKGSQGVPHYLDLAVDTVERTKDEGQRTKLTGENPDELVTQFMRHLDRSELEALQVLSAPRYWYYGLFENLMSEYETGYPPSAYDDLSRFSFVSEGAASGTQTMHELMREALQEAQSPELRKRVHLFLHEHYARQLQGLDAKGVTDKHRAALSEAFYHGLRALNAKQLWAWFKVKVDDYEDAIQPRHLLLLRREMAEALEAELGPDHPDNAEALSELGAELVHLGDYDEAEPILRRAVAIAEAVTGGTSCPHSQILLNLIWLLWERGDFGEAEVLGRSLVGRLESERGADIVVLVTALFQLAQVLKDRGAHAESDGLYRRALRLSESELGPDHELTALTLGDLASLLVEQWHIREAEPLNRRALDIAERTKGTRSLVALNQSGNLGMNLHLQGRLFEAQTLMRRTLHLFEEILGQEHPRTSVNMHNLAALLCDSGRYDEAEILSRRALTQHRRKAGPDHPYNIRIEGQLITILAKQGKCREAEPMARRALADCEQKRGTDHPDTIAALSVMGDVLDAEGRYTDAEDYMRRAADARIRASGREHPGALRSLDVLASIKERLGKYAEAESLCREVLPTRERVHGPEHPLVATTANRLAGLCSRDGRHAEAEALYRRALAIREKVFGLDHPFLAEVLDGLAKVCEQTGRTAEAQELSARAQRIRAQAGLAPTNPQQQS
jgi:tetratricopeptide (TPR) repeat protein